MLLHSESPWIAVAAANAFRHARKKLGGTGHKHGSIVATSLIALEFEWVGLRIRFGQMVFHLLG